MGKLKKISGPVVHAEEMSGSQINEIVSVGREKLMGEIIALKGSDAAIQVYEDTNGLRPGEPVVPSGDSLSVELGPGLLSGVFDGIQRPLSKLSEKSSFITRGVSVNSLDRSKKWEFIPVAKKGSKVTGGDVLGTVKEFDIEHKIMVPPKVSGKVDEIKESGKYTIEQVIATISDKGKSTDVKMYQRWPVRIPRPCAEKRRIELPLLTGMRIFDTFFPVAKGGAAAIPGPFGSGKTVAQTSLAKYCDAKIIVYIGCGERGNEMTEVLSEFPKLTDPHTGKPLMNRTVLIANTSNMPVAAREASIYTGITIAEYFRDMGYDIALMADSTSRWAEAMREISGRMEEMPGEEGYPAYLNRKLAEFYERTGRVTCLGSDANKVGSVTAVGAVSPAGGDLSEPVSQGTLSVTKVFWALDAPLARRRHYPAINWLKSYSLYHDDLEQWYDENVSEEFYDIRSRAMALLQKESELQSIVQLIGPDALPDKERIVLEVTKMIREDFLQQNAYDAIDATSSLNKQYLMLKTILHFYDKASTALTLEMPFEKIVKAPEKVKISQMKRVEEKDIEKTCKAIMGEIDARFKV
ncbi:MAG: V-type ATP synthase subunit A [Candidatus Micrarchaeota archaeon]